VFYVVERYDLTDIKRRLSLLLLLHYNTYVGTTGAGLRTAEAVRTAVCACAALVALLRADVVGFALRLRRNTVRRSIGDLAIPRSMVFGLGFVVRLGRRLVVIGSTIDRRLWLVIWTVYVRQLTIAGDVGFIYWIWRKSTLTCKQRDYNSDIPSS